MRRRALWYSFIEGEIRLQLVFLSAFDLGHGDDLQVDAAVENEASQDKEKHNRRDERPPLIFGAPWVGPPAVVHIRAKRLIAPKQNVLNLCRVP
jgi:hypothetical protein